MDAIAPTLDCPPPVLIVEDNEAARCLISEIVKDAFPGNQPAAFADAENAWTYLETCPAARLPELALLDIGLPLMSGNQLCTLIRNHTHTADLYLVAVTAQHDPKDVDTLLENGIDDYFPKPVSPEILKLKLRVWKHTLTRIARQRRTQKLLQQSEERHRLITQNSRDVICIVDPQTTIHYISPSVEHLLGYQPQNLLESQFKDIVHPSDRKNLFLNTPPTEGILEELTAYRLLDAQGNAHHVHAVHRPIQNSPQPSVKEWILYLREIPGLPKLAQQLAALPDVLRQNSLAISIDNLGQHLEAKILIFHQDSPVCQSAGKPLSPSLEHWTKTIAAKTAQPALMTLPGHTDNAPWTCLSACPLVHPGNPVLLILHSRYPQNEQEHQLLIALTEISAALLAPRLPRELASA